MQLSSYLESILAVAAEGQPILPWRYVGEDKVPYIKEWQHNATTDPDTIREWWSKWPDAGVGGLVLPGHVGIDIDIKEGALGAQNLQKLFTESTALKDAFKETKRNETVSGGAHFLFLANPRYDGLLTNTSNHPWNGIDYRVAGKGWLSLPPTPGYTVKNAGPRIMLPDDFYEYYKRDVALLEEAKHHGNGSNGTIYKSGFTFQSGNILKGARNNTVFRMGCSLQGQGFSDEAIVDAMTIENGRLEKPMEENRLNPTIASVLKLPKGTKNWGSTDEPDYSGNYDFSNMVYQKDILKRGIVPPDWEIDGLFERHDGPIFVTGDSGAFKTWTLLFIERSLLTGEPLFGHFKIPKPRPYAFHINLDSGKMSTENRIARLSKTGIEHWMIEKWYEWDWNRFESFLKTMPLGWITLDCYMNIFKTPDRMDENEATRTGLDRMKNLFEIYHSNGGIIDHIPRAKGREASEMYYGKAQKKAAMRQGFSVRKLSSSLFNDALGLSHKSTLVEFQSLKPGDYEEWQPFVVEFKIINEQMTATYMGPSADIAGHADDNGHDYEAEIINTLREADEPLKFSDLHAEYPTIPTYRLREIIASSATIQKTGGSKSTKYYVDL